MLYFLFKTSSLLGNRSTREEYSPGWVLFFLSVARSKPAVTNKQHSCWWQRINFLLHPVSFSLISFGFFMLVITLRKFSPGKWDPGEKPGIGLSL